MADSTLSSDGSLAKLVEAHAQDRGDAIAIGSPLPGRSPMTYRQLDAHVKATAAGLASLGVNRGDRVAAVLPNGPELASLFVASASVAGFAPLNQAYRDKEFEFFLGDLKPRVLVVSAGSTSPAIGVAQRLGVRVVEMQVDACVVGLFTLVGASAAAPSFGSADDVALVLHTSGTTARPKIVPLSQRNLMTSAGNIARTLKLQPSDRCLNVMPLFHIHGLMGATLASIHAGASVHCAPEFDPQAFLSWLSDAKPTWYTAVPTMHQAVLERAQAAGPKKTTLRFIRSSSASLPPKVKDDLERVFDVPVVESYGMTEAAHQMTSNPLPPGARKAGSVGMAAGPEVAVLDADGKPVPQGERGEVSIKGANVTAGYESNPAANESAFTSTGFFRTGDEGYFDADGYLFLTGRLKEIINRGGEKITPREIDELLLMHPSVRQAVTFAVPHTTLGEDVAAAVILKPGTSATEQELRDFLTPQVAAFKVPQQIVIVDEIPKGPSGKLQRIGLAEKLADKLKPSYVAPTDPLERALAEIWAEVLNVPVDQIGVTDSFFSLGGDSLSVERILVQADKRLQIAPSTIFRFPTIREIVDAHRAEKGEVVVAPPTSPIGPVTGGIAQIATGDDPPRSMMQYWIVGAALLVAAGWLLLR